MTIVPPELNCREADSLASGGRGNRLGEFAELTIRTDPAIFFETAPMVTQFFYSIEKMRG